MLVLGKNNYKLDRSRIIGFADVDAFAVQVFFSDKKVIENEPCVLALSDEKGRDNGRIIAANHIAKRLGIDRKILLRKAKKICPHLKIVIQEQKHGKPNMMPLLTASDQINDAIVTFLAKINRRIIVQKASNDEFYFDLSDYVNDCLNKNITYDNEELNSMQIKMETSNKQLVLSNRDGMNKDPLTHAAVLMHRLYEEIKIKLGFVLSFGVSYNKLLAKIGCGLNKPNSITVIKSKGGIARIFDKYSLLNVEGFQQAFGRDIKEKLNINTLMDLRTFSRQELRVIQANDKKKWNISAENLWNIARGICSKKVECTRLINKMNSGRTIAPGLRSLNKLQFVVQQELHCLYEKLDYDRSRNKRMPTKLKAQFSLNSGRVNEKRLFPVSVRNIENFLTNYSRNEIIAEIWRYMVPKIIQRTQTLSDKFVHSIQLTVSNFVAIEDINQMKTAFVFNSVRYVSDVMHVNSIASKASVAYESSAYENYANWMSSYYNV